MLDATRVRLNNHAMHRNCGPGRFFSISVASHNPVTIRVSLNMETPTEKTPIVWALAWFGLLWALFIFHDPLTVPFLFMLYFPVLWAVLLAGIAVAAFAIATFGRSRIRAASVFLICTAGVTLYFSTGFDWGRYLLFQIRKPAYELQRIQVLATGRCPKGKGIPKMDRQNCMLSTGNVESQTTGLRPFMIRLAG